VKHLDYLQAQSAELRLEESLIGELTDPHAENCLMILSYMELKHLLLLYMTGYREVQEQWSCEVLSRDETLDGKRIWYNGNIGAVKFLKPKS